MAALNTDHPFNKPGLIKEYKMPKLIRPRELPIPSRPLSEASWKKLRLCDEQLLDAAYVSERTVPQLRRTINSVPKKERGVDWVERVVSIYAVKAMKGRRCSALMKRMEQKRIADGEPEKYAEFKKRLIRQYECGTPHEKFNMTFEFSSNDKANKSLRRVVDVLVEGGWQTFINSGTLLGAVRDKSFIQHDYDADVAVILKGDTNREVIEGFNAVHRYLVSVYGDDIIRSRFKSKRPTIKVKLKSGLVVDVFPAWERDGQFYVWPHTFGELTIDDILPFKDGVIDGVTYPIPQNSEAMLALNYGEMWHTPDSTFDFPWDAAEAKFDDLLTEFRLDTQTYQARTWLSRFKRQK